MSLERVLLEGKEKVILCRGSENRKGARTNSGKLYEESGG